MRPRHVDSWWAQWTCVGGTCAPEAAPARSRFERALDVYTNVTGPLLRGCVVFLTVAVAAAASSALGPVTGLLIAAAFFLVAGTYCLANFARCRETHCIVTGPGWSVLAIAGFGATVAGRDIRGEAWTAFLVIAIAGYAFEAAWRAARGSYALQAGRL